MSTRRSRVLSADARDYKITVGDGKTVLDVSAVLVNFRALVPIVP